MNHLRSCENADYASVGLGWGLRVCISNKSQLMPVLLVYGPFLG